MITNKTKTKSPTPALYFFKGTNSTPSKELTLLHLPQGSQYRRRLKVTDSMVASKGWFKQVKLTNNLIFHFNLYFQLSSLIWLLKRALVGRKIDGVVITFLIFGPPLWELIMSIQLILNFRMEERGRKGEPNK